MPFKSKKQEKWAFATKQPFAQKWADMTDQQKLPVAVRVVKKKKAKLDGRTRGMKRLGFKKSMLGG